MIFSLYAPLFYTISGPRGRAEKLFFGLFHVIFFKEGAVGSPIEVVILSRSHGPYKSHKAKKTKE